MFAQDITQLMKARDKVSGSRLHMQSLLRTRLLSQSITPRIYCGRVNKHCLIAAFIRHQYHCLQGSLQFSLTGLHGFGILHASVCAWNQQSRTNNQKSSTRNPRPRAYTVDTHTQPIEERIDWVFQIAEQYADSFSSPEVWLARQRYRAEHPTAILVLKCMDGRVNIPNATQTPKGIMMPFRNLGGMFNLGWPHLSEVLAHNVQRAVGVGRRALIMISYHFSKGDKHRGCAGFNYDTEAAFAHTLQIRAEVEHTFGLNHEVVYPLVCGFETDEDAITVHGINGTSLNLAELDPSEISHLPQRLATLLPDMPTQVRADLLPLLLGNLRHIAEIRNAKRALQIEHREWMICVGRGFDFLQIPNLALIIGPYSPDLADPIRKAAGIIDNNMQTGRIPDDGFLLLASVPYENIGVDHARAQLKAQFLCQFAAEEIERHRPELAKKMHVRTAVMDWRTRRLEDL
jgi:hypothetical protein